MPSVASGLPPVNLRQIYQLLLALCSFHLLYGHCHHFHYQPLSVEHCDQHPNQVQALQGVQMPATVENWSLPGNFGVDLIGNQRGISLKKDLIESDRAAEE